MAGETTIDIHELQRRLSCSRSAAYALVASGVLRTVRVGRAVRIPESVVQEFIRSGGVRVIPSNRCGRQMERARDRAGAGAVAEG